MAEIVLDGVTKRYADGTEAVKQLDLRIADGEFMVLVGPSGCGKTTALRMLAGLETISGGELRIGGEVVNDRTPKQRDIAMVFQNYALYPHMTVGENMGFALKLAKVDKPEIRRRVEEAARILELSDHVDRKPAQLSGGQRQRVAMGRAIVREPQAFLMDEPLSNLDAKLRVQMRAEIARIQQRLGTTTVYVTHDQTEAMTLGDGVAVMRSGVLQQLGPPKRLYEEPANLFVAGFIGSPAMNFLAGTIEDGAVRLPLGAVPLSDALRARLATAPGGAPARGARVIAGLRPEAFEDAAFVDPTRNPGGIAFDAAVELVESMGSEVHAHFAHDGEQVRSDQLDELAADAGTRDLADARGMAVARLHAESRAQVGERCRLWLDVRRLHLFDPANGRSLLGPASAGPDAATA